MWDYDFLLYFQFREFQICGCSNILLFKEPGRPVSRRYKIMDITLHKKWSFLLRISTINVTKSDLVTFTEEILNRNFHFLSSVSNKDKERKWKRIMTCLTLLRTYIIKFSVKILLLNPFHIPGLFLYPLKISEKVWFRKRGHRKRPVVWNVINNRYII